MVGNYDIYSPVCQIDRIESYLVDIKREAFFVALTIWHVLAEVMIFTRRTSSQTSLLHIPHKGHNKVTNFPLKANFWRVHREVFGPNPDMMAKKSDS